MSEEITDKELALLSYALADSEARNKTFYDVNFGENVAHQLFNKIINLRITRMRRYHENVSDE